MATAKNRNCSWLGKCIKIRLEISIYKSLRKFDIHVGNNCSI